MRTAPSGRAIDSIGELFEASCSLKSPRIASESRDDVHFTGTHWSGPLFFGIKNEQTNSKSREAR